MSMLARAVGVSAILLSLCAPLARAADPQPGLWNITSVSERNGVTVARRSLETCLDADAAKRLTEAGIDSEVDPRNECKPVDTQQVGNSLTWRVQCTGRVPAESKALFVFDSPDRYSAVITTTLTLARTTLTSTLKIEGRRAGDCPR